MEKLKRTLGFLFQHPLAKKHPFRALFRLLWWQLQNTATPNRFKTKPYIGKVRFKARKGLTGITGNIYTGLHEFNDMSFLLHFLRPEDVFFDVGANLGSYSLLAAGVCGVHTVAVEATAAILSQNIALNQLQPKVKIINAAAGAASGFISFSTGGDTTNHVVSDQEPGSSNTIQVDVITIDSIHTNQAPALIKIDVEGFETEVLRGMPHTLSQDNLKAIIIELNGSGGRYGFDERNIHRQLLAHGFKPYQYDPFIRNLLPLNNFGSYNTIYCRDIKFVLKRLHTAEPFKILGEVI